MLFFWISKVWRAIIVWDSDNSLTILISASYKAFIFVIINNLHSFLLLLITFVLLWKYFQTLITYKYNSMCFLIQLNADAWLVLCKWIDVEICKIGNPEIIAQLEHLYAKAHYSDHALKYLRHITMNLACLFMLSEVFILYAIDGVNIFLGVVFG